MTENIKSAKDMLPKKVLKPRQYQLELLEYVTNRNGIIYLPTGAGKSYVAILAIRRFSHDLDKPLGEGGKRIIFMTNTVELARQQMHELKNCTNFKIGFYVGERDVDSWSRRKWDDEIQGNQVLVGTTQIFLDIVMKRYIKISDLSLVVIDECHHATKQHPMHEFMHLFMYADQTQLPRVIGLTGVLLKGNKLTNIQQDLQNLESTFRGNIVTVSSRENFQNVMIYSTKPKEELVSYRTDNHQFNTMDSIEITIRNLMTIVDKFDLGNIPIQLTKSLQQQREPNKKKSIKNLFTDFSFQMKDYGLYTAAIAIMSLIIEFEVKKRQAETLALRQLYRIVITKCEYIRHLLVKKLHEFNDDDGDGNGNNDTLDMIMNYSTPKLRALFAKMQSDFAGKTANDISCLVFVERRYTAKCLYYVIQKFVELSPQLRDIIRPQFMVGRNNIITGISSILETKWNKKAIESFREKECNLIICSKVLEEGIDVQACNYVYAFDPLKTFNSYIQTKGRARSANSTYAVFTDQIDQMKTVQQIKKYTQVHEAIKNYLIGRILDRDDPREEQIQVQFESILKPLVIKSGAMLLPSAAYALIYHYCQTLPSDMFGLMSPSFFRTKHPNTQQEVVACRLPIQSLVKETVYSDAMSDTKLMKASAAMKVCKLLYEKGELNERFMPITKKECLAKISDELFAHWKAYDDNILSQNVGKTHRRMYDRMCPEEFYNAMPIVGEKCFAYEVQFSTNFSASEYTSHIVDMINVNSSYAILLRHRLPRLADMPLYMNQGELTVKIAENPIECCITNDNELRELRQFHLMILRDLLNVWKTFFVLDNRNKENSYLLVPLKAVNAMQNKSCKQIDWNLVREFQHLQPRRRYSVIERQQAIYRPEDYLGKVITKWYGSDDQHYVVKAVRTDLSPLSSFTDKNYGTYEQFTLSRYGHDVERITQPQQFLLEVRALTSRRNFFVNAIGKKTERRGQVIHLIPELCHNIRYPSDMWLKALLLPSVLHRVYYMLHANALRRRVNLFLELPLTTEAQYKPKPIMVDTSLKRVVDNDGNAVVEEEHQVKVLPALAPKSKKSIIEVRSLVDDDTTLWKDYLEPVDHARLNNSIYPVEIDYYYKFIQGLTVDLDQLHLDTEEEWTKSQLSPVLPTPENTAYADANGVPCVASLSIEDVPMVDKRRIEILERSFNANTNSNVMQSAEQFEFLAALTTSAASDVFDMERLEILGDSFLKFSVSLYLANKYPNFHEGYLTEIKSKLVSNRNLLYCLLSVDIPKRICSTLFNPKGDWLPPLASLPHNILATIAENPTLLNNISPRDLFSLELDDDQVMNGVCNSKLLNEFLSGCRRNDEICGSGANTSNLNNEMGTYLNKTIITDKVVADTLEALLGVCVKNYGIHRGFQMLEFFGICRRKDGDKPLTNLLDLHLGSSLLRTNINQSEVDGFLINYKTLEKNLGYTFKDRAYLLQALTHPSFPTNRLTGCYQELEFIGDAILDFLISSYIFERFERMTPGEVTDVRSALVNNITLGCVCVRHRFHLFLLCENSVLSEAIKTFANYQDTQHHRVTDQIRILMEESVAIGDVMSLKNDDASSGNAAEYNLAVNVDVPKTLGDIVEALIAAVYLDSRDLTKTWHVIYRLLEPELNDFAHNVPIDPVRQLYEHKSAKPNFSKAIFDGDTAMVICQFTCLDVCLEANGFGKDGKQAKKSAAKHALKILAKHSN